jgi:hypothetical protein
MIPPCFSKALWGRPDRGRLGVNLCYKFDTVLVKFYYSLKSVWFKKLGLKALFLDIFYKTNNCLLSLKSLQFKLVDIPCVEGIFGPTRLGPLRLPKATAADMTIRSAFEIGDPSRSPGRV